MKPNTKHIADVANSRALAVMVGFGLFAAILVLYRMYMHVVDRSFLTAEAMKRHEAQLSVPGNRGKVLDRFGKPLAFDAPTEDVWADPRLLVKQQSRFPALAQALGWEAAKLQATVESQAARGRKFMNLKRKVSPGLARQLAAMAVPGVHFKPSTARFYPLREASSHLLGFVNIDGKGQRGIERAYDEWLYGQFGSQKVLRDRHGKVVRVLDAKKDGSGQDLQLSIDRRLQYIAYRELREAKELHRAKGGSAMVVDVESGEVLAMVSQPGFNPHLRSDLRGTRLVNKAVEHVFEPGSTMKPFVVATALERLNMKPTTIVDTSPGKIWLDKYEIKDSRNYGKIPLTTVLTKSSNVGSIRLALAMKRKDLWESFTRFGFGTGYKFGLPAEADGTLRHYKKWNRVDQGSAAYGYGLSVTTSQLAQAYSVLAAEGKWRPLRLMQDKGVTQGTQVLSRNVAKQVVRMLETVVAEGTAKSAAIRGYRVAGKTGTARKAEGKKGYTGKHIALFAGMAPASNPKFVCVVMIDEPGRSRYYGGQLAAPVFSAIVGEALRLYDVPPDAVKVTRVAQAGDS